MQVLIHPLVYKAYHILFVYLLQFQSCDSCLFDYHFATATSENVSTIVLSFTFIFELDYKSILTWMRLSHRP
jgi:hypothetical protein